MGIRSRVRLKLETGTGGGGSAVSNGDAIDSTLTANGTGVIWDIDEVSRPVTVEKNPDGNIVAIYTTTDVNALLDPDHASWEVLREDAMNTYEVITARGIVGIQARVISGSGTSTVRVYARYTGPEYNPVYDPGFDVAFADLSDSRRFLRQAGFGEFPGEAQTLLSSGRTAGEEFDLLYDGAYRYHGGAFPATAGTFPVITEGAGAGDNAGRRSLAASWQYRSLVWRHSPDTFRGRIVAAWNKQLAIGNILSETTSRAWERTQNSLFDMMDGTLQDYVRWLAYARYPQWFLDNINNKGREPAFQLYDVEPNQNWVRELFQLFTLGQWELNLDGSFKLDAFGNRIPTYVYLDVLNAARLFSGLNLSGTSAELVCTATDHYRGAVDMPTPGITRAAYGGVPTLGTKFVQGENVYGKIEEVCDWLYNHDTFLVYFCLHFIRELVTENPTPQYVRRVVAAAQDNGLGVRGSVRDIMRAIYLDPEARGTIASKDADRFGRALDIHLALASAWRAAEQRDVAEFGYTCSVSVTNGSTTATVAAGDNLPLQAHNGSWRVSGTGLLSTATATWATNTTLTLNTAYTGTTGTYTFEFARPLNASLFEGVENTGWVDSGSANNGPGKVPAEWGITATVFNDYPFDYEIDDGYLGRAASLWTPEGVLALWNGMPRGSIHHSKNGTYAGILTRRHGVWDMTYMVAGSPTNAQLVDRAIEVVLCGRTIPSAARLKVIEILDQAALDSAAEYGAPDNAMKLDRRAALALSCVDMLPQAMEQI
jgi:hypothetical protein